MMLLRSPARHLDLAAGRCRLFQTLGRDQKHFTQSWLAAGGNEQPLSDSRHRYRRRGVWQRRFWEHALRDQRDFNIHCDYIHYNPVKHGYVARGGLAPSELSSLCRNGVYLSDWTGHPDLIDTVGFGE